MADLRDLRKDQKCPGGEVRLLQSDCPGHALSHSGSFEAWEETSVFVGKPVYAVQSLMSVFSLE